MPYIVPNMRRRRYTDIVRAEAPLARRQFFEKKARDLEAKNLATSKELAEQQLAQQQTQFDSSLAEQARQHKENIAMTRGEHESDLAERKRQFEEQYSQQEQQHQGTLAETMRQHNEQIAARDKQHTESLAAEKSNLAKDLNLQRDIASEHGRQADMATKISLAGLGVEAAPYLSSLAKGAGAKLAGTAATTAAAKGAAAAGAAPAVTGGAGAATATGSVTPSAGMGAMAGAGTAVGVPLAIAIMSGKFKQLGGKGVTPVKKKWGAWNADKRNKRWANFTPEQKASIFSRFQGDLSEDQKRDAFLSFAQTSQFSMGKHYKKWLKSKPKKERSALMAEYNRIKQENTQQEWEPGD